MQVRAPPATLPILFPQDKLPSKKSEQNAEFLRPRSPGITSHDRFILAGVRWVAAAVSRGECGFLAMLDLFENILDHVLVFVGLKLLLHAAQCDADDVAMMHLRAC